MSKSVIWSSAVFALFMGSAAYVGVSTAMTPPMLGVSQASTETVAVAAKPRAKTAKGGHAIAPGAMTSAALNEYRS